MKVIGYSLNTLLALITVASGYGTTVNPNISCVPAILAMTFPLWVVLTLVVLVLDIFIDKRMAMIPGASLIICIGPILSICPLNLSRDKLSAEEEKRSFTVMSYNVYGLHDCNNPNLHSTYDSIPMKQERNKGISNPTLSWILKQDCDIACLQELSLYVDKEAPMYITRELYDSVCRKYPYRVVGNRNGILSKYPLYPIDLPQDEEKTAFHQGAIAEIQGHRTLIISAHLQSIGLNSSDKELYREITDGEGGKAKLKEAKQQLLAKLSLAFTLRTRQAELIRRQIDSLNVENVIICGDFNDIQDCYAMRILSSNDFKSAFATAGFGPTITYHANRFYFHIDHILYRGELEAINFRKYNFARSDHYPISSRFLWTEDAKKVDRNRKGINLIDRN